MKKYKLNWPNLRKNKCPKCNADWAKKAEMRGHLIRCMGGTKKEPCNFIISKVRLTKIVNSMVNKELQERDEEAKSSSRLPEA